MADATRQDGRDRPGVTLRPLVDFLHTEAAGGVVLLVAALVAMVWANSPWKDSYAELWHTRLVIDLGGHVLDLDLQEWVNDGLMTIFFFVVGLEIKRELVEGELRDRRRAALPAIAALGGMIVPALIYVVINLGGEGIDGWGIPMATDIAMAVGVLSLLGARVVPSLKLFLLTLAIVDDIGAIVVIAVFYSDDFDPPAFAASIVIVLVIAVVKRLDVQQVWVYVPLGFALWLAVHESGIHATLAGVVLGLMTPARPRRQSTLVDADEIGERLAQQVADGWTVEAAQATVSDARDSVSVVEWLEHRLHPWSSFAIVPLFALANAGVPITADALSAAASSRITFGVLGGLVVGKLVGVTAFTWLATRLRIADLPPGATWGGLIGVAALAGIGFTVSLFVTGLAFDSVVLQDDAKIAIVAASTTAAALGSLLLLRRRAS